MDSWGPFPTSTFFFGFFPGLLKTAVIFAVVGGLLRRRPASNEATQKARNPAHDKLLHGQSVWFLTSSVFSVTVLALVDV